MKHSITCEHPCPGWGCECFCHPCPISPRENNVLCMECGGDMAPWEFDGEAGWSCISCGYQEDAS